MQPIATKYEFKTTPYDHQSVGLKQSWNREEYALFCEMGTGKSKILIDNIGVLFERDEITAAVIVAPKGVYKNWQRSELPIHMPDRIMEQCDIIAWTPDTTKKTFQQLQLALKKDGRFKILVINVEAFSSNRGTDFATKFVATHQCLMAVDESTTIKNRTAKRTKNIIKVGSRAKYRRILTGSPVTKSPRTSTHSVHSLEGILSDTLPSTHSKDGMLERFAAAWEATASTRSSDTRTSMS